MFIWSILWFCLKIEYIVDLDIKKSYNLFFIPTINISRSEEDNVRCRQYTLSIMFLNFGVHFHIYRPWFYIINNQGQYLGNRTYPNVLIESIYSVTQQEYDEMNNLLNHE